MDRELESGRTKPLVCGCETASGENAGDFVIKLRSEVNGDTTGLACEWMGTAAARMMGIKTPHAAAVRLPEELVEAVAMVNPALAQRLRRNDGLHFGSKLEIGTQIWASTLKLLPSMIGDAVAIFAMDAVIDNADRRIEKPNLLTKGEELIAIDHESGFGFLYAVIRPWDPWEASKMSFLRSHVLYRALKGQPFERDALLSRLGGLTGEWARATLRAMPEEWNNERVHAMVDHFGSLEARTADLVDQIRILLA